jgi:hypothetical protein
MTKPDRPKPGCFNCIYCYYSLRMKMSGFAPGFPVRPLCSNHPDAPGELREVFPSRICRNYRPQPRAPAQPADTVRRIPMAHGQFVLVDAADYEWLRKYKWSPRGSGRYAARRENGKTIYMHREIMNAPEGMVVDHIDGNAPNNCRSNLRVCTPGQNRYNQAKRIGCTSRFKGVHRDSKSGKWFVMIRPDDKPLWLGYFDTEAEAARAYDRLAVELFGEFAYLNFPEEWTPERRQEAYAQKEAIRAAQKAKTQRDEMRKKAKGKRARTSRQDAGTQRAKTHDEGRKTGRKEGKTATHAEGRTERLRGSASIINRK